MRAGRLRHYATVKSDTSADGAEQPTYTDLITEVPCNVVPVSGIERYRGMQLEATTAFVVETRYDSRLKPDLQIVDHLGRVLNISSVVSMKGRDRDVMIQCTEVTV